jgi:hypothetical protein
MRRGSYSPPNSRRLASANWPSRLENIIHRTKRLALSFVPTNFEYGCALPALSCRCHRRSVSRTQNKAICLSVSSPAPHWHLGVSKPGTLRLYRNLARPIRPVRAWTSSALSALWRSLWSPKTRPDGGVSSGTTWWFPRPLLGRTRRPSLLFSAYHRFFQSWRTSFFSCQS